MRNPSFTAESKVTAEIGILLAGLDLEGLAQQPAQQVELPQLAAREAELHGWGNLGVVEFLSSILEDILPFSEGAAAQLTLLQSEPPDQEAELEHRQGALKQLSRKRLLT